jgi:isopentenyl-diphosphate delta-isomerase type 1
MVMNNLDQVILVNSQDEPIGVMDKVVAHRGEGKLHRAISVFLFRKLQDEVELLIQQRSTQKIVGAGLWANTVCGNVRPNEDREQCAQRRLLEELGIVDAKLTPIYKFEYQVKCNQEFSENEIDEVYVGWLDGEVEPNPAEVANYQWVKWSTLINKSANLDLAPWFEIMLKDPILINKITA